MAYRRRMPRRRLVRRGRRPAIRRPGPRPIHNEAGRSYDPTVGKRYTVGTTSGSGSALTDSSGSTFYELAPTAGTTIKTFFGNAVKCFGVTIFGNLKSRTDAFDYCRLIVYQSTTRYAAGVNAIAAILDTDENSGDGINADCPLDNAFDGKVLYDKKYFGTCLGPGTASGAVNNMVPVNLSIKADQILQYGETGTLSTGQVGVVFISTVNGTTTTRITWDGMVRFHYMDGWNWNRPPKKV